MSPLESGILGLYFLTLVILAILGCAPLHHGVAVLPAPGAQGRAPPAAGAAAPGDGPAPHLQRDVRGGAADRVGGGDPLPAGSPGDPGARRLHRRDLRHRPTGGRAAPGATGFDIHYIHREDRIGYKAGALDAGLEARHRASSSSSSTPTSWPRPTSSRRPSDTSPTPRSGLVQMRWGHLNRELLAPHPGPVDLPRRPLRHRARCPQPLGPLLQLQRHRRHLAARDDRRRRGLGARHPHRGPGPLLPGPD